MEWFLEMVVVWRVVYVVYCFFGFCMVCDYWEVDVEGFDIYGSFCKLWFVCGDLY